MPLTLYGISYRLFLLYHIYPTIVVYTFLYIRFLDPYIRKFVSIFVHSHHRYFIDTRPIATRPPLVRISSIKIYIISYVRVTLSRLQRAYNISYLAIFNAIRSISVSILGRYSRILLIEKLVYRFLFNDLSAE